MTEATKTCSKCQTVKPLDEYYRHRLNRDGLEGTCKACKAAYHVANRERNNSRTAAWYAANSERKLARMDAYRAENPHITWEARYRSRARALGFDPVVRSFTREDMLTYWNNGPFCIYCDAAWSEIEHVIPVGLGGIHAVENVAPSCGPCNRANISYVKRERRSPIAA